MNRRKTEPPRGVLKTAAAEPAAVSPRPLPPIPGPRALRRALLGGAHGTCAGSSPERAETLPHPSVHMIFERPGRQPHRRRRARQVLASARRATAASSPSSSVPAASTRSSMARDLDVHGHGSQLREVFGAAGRWLDRRRLAETTDDARIARRGFPAPAASRRPTRACHASQRSSMPSPAIGRSSEVDDLVERYGLNTRALQRLFAKYVGVSPKWVIQRYRLHEAAEQLAASATVNQADTRARPRLQRSGALRPRLQGGRRHVAGRLRERARGM